MATTAAFNDSLSGRQLTILALLYDAPNVRRGIDMAKGTAQDAFRAKAPDIMGKLMADFPLQLDDVAAIVGNFGYESAGFTALQELKPVVKGSLGGYGWPMWTGPRRRAYEAYCQRNGLDPASDKANYAYVFVELSGDYNYAVAAVKKAVGLQAKVKAFELAYERAGVKHYASRNQWAAIALEAWHDAKKLKPAQQPASGNSESATPPTSSEPAKPVPAPSQAPRTPSPTVALPGKVEDKTKNGTAGKVLAAVIVLAIGAAAAALGISK